MRRERVRLSRRHQAWIYSSVGVLFGSGVLWVAAQIWFVGDGVFGESTSPLAPWSMKLHGAAAMLVLIVLGTLLPGHVRRAWNAGKSRRTGAGVLGINGLLIVSGYALYYVGGESTRAVMSPLHWIAGLVLPFALAGHVWQGHRQRAEKSRWRTHRRRARSRAAVPRHRKDEPAEPVAIPAPSRPLHREILE